MILMDGFCEKTEAFSHLPQGYQYLACCGAGSYGVTYLVRDFSGVEQVLKIVRKVGDRDVWERELRGLKAYRQLSQEHPNLVQIYHVEDARSYFYYTMSPADNLSCEKEMYLPATLENRIKRESLTPEQVLKIGLSLLDAVEFLHNEGLVHRDIKPSNIIFINGELKLSDIGLVREMKGNASLVGSPDFLPPEMLLRRNETSPIQFDSKYDLYAIGKVLYCALTGKSCKNFPHVELSLLNSRLAVRLNRAILEVCDPNPEWRIDTIESFRRHLNGDYDTKPVRNITHDMLRNSGSYLRNNLHIPVYISLTAFSILGGVIMFDAWASGKSSIPDPRSSYSDIKDFAQNLSAAIRKKNSFFLLNLLQRNPLSRSLLQKDYTFLSEAISYGTPKQLRLLLENGADPNVRSKDGKTPLMKAAECGNLQGIRILLEFGADKKLLDQFGKNASAYATSAKKQEIYTLLQ